MPQTVTLTLPDSFFQPIQRTAQATQQPIEELLLTALQTSLPSLEGLPDEVAGNLTALETLDDDNLCQVLRETVPRQVQKKISALLEEQPLTPLASEKLDALQQQADLVMLRKARAAVLLRFRGKRLPTLAELEFEQNG